jgi:hypothetical protein
MGEGENQDGGNAFLDRAFWTALARQGASAHIGDRNARRLDRWPAGRHGVLRGARKSAADQGGQRLDREAVRHHHGLGASPRSRAGQNGQRAALTGFELSPQHGTGEWRQPANLSISGTTVPAPARNGLGHVDLGRDEGDRCRSFREVAQPAEQRALNAQVTGSSPVFPANCSAK